MPAIKSDDVTAAIDAVEKWRRAPTAENAEAAGVALANLPGTWIVVDGTWYTGDRYGNVYEAAGDDEEEIPF